MTRLDRIPFESAVSKAKKDVKVFYKCYFDPRTESSKKKFAALKSTLEAKENLLTNFNKGYN